MPSPRISAIIQHKFKEHGYSIEEIGDGLSLKKDGAEVYYCLANDQLEDNLMYRTIHKVLQDHQSGVHYLAEAEYGNLRYNSLSNHEISSYYKDQKIINRVSHNINQYLYQQAKENIDDSLNEIAENFLEEIFENLILVEGVDFNKNNLKVIIGDDLIALLKDKINAVEGYKNFIDSFAEQDLIPFITRLKDMGYVQADQVQKISQTISSKVRLAEETEIVSMLKHSGGVDVANLKRSSAASNTLKMFGHQEFKDLKQANSVQNFYARFKYARTNSPLNQLAQNKAQNQRIAAQLQESQIDEIVAINIRSGGLGGGHHLLLKIKKSAENNFEIYLENSIAVPDPDYQKRGLEFFVQSPLQALMPGSHFEVKGISEVHRQQRDNGCPVATVFNVLDTAYKVDAASRTHTQAEEDYMRMFMHLVGDEVTGVDALVDGVVEGVNNRGVVAPEPLTRVEQLFSVIEAGNQAGLDNLLTTEDQSDINIKDANGKTLLMHAISSKKPNLVSHLLEQGAAVDMVDAFGVSPLHYAIMFGDNAVVSEILARGAVVNKADLSNTSPLHYAIMSGNEAIVATLLSHEEIAPDRKDASGMTALHYAISFGHTKLVKQLRDKIGAGVLDIKGPEGKPILEYAFNCGNAEIMNLLLGSDNLEQERVRIAGVGTVSVDDGERGQEYYPEEFERLASKCFDLFDKVNQVRSRDSKEGRGFSDEPMYQTLLNNFSQPLDVNNYELFQTSYYHLIEVLGHYKVIPEILDSDAKKIDQASLLLSTLKRSKGTPEYQTIKEQALEIIQTIGDVNLFSGSDNLLLRIAKGIDDPEILDAVLARGADLNVKGKFFNNTPLHWAIANANNDMAKAILERRYNERSLELDHLALGNTALHLACAKGYVTEDSDGKTFATSNRELTKLIIARGADLNIKGKNGNTALHLACARHDFELIKLLVDSGRADLTISNEQGRTAMDMLDLNYIDAYAVIADQASPFQLDDQGFNPENVRNIKSYLERKMTSPAPTPPPPVRSSPPTLPASELSTPVRPAPSASELSTPVRPSPHRPRHRGYRRIDQVKRRESANLHQKENAKEDIAREEEPVRNNDAQQKSGSKTGVRVATFTVTAICAALAAIFMPGLGLLEVESLVASIVSITGATAGAVGFGASFAGSDKAAADKSQSIKQDGKALYHELKDIKLEGVQLRGSARKRYSATDRKADNKQSVQSR